MSFYSLSSYSQYRINQSAIGGTPTPPPFSDVNSFSFDGIDDYFVGVGGYTELSSGNAMSVSVWFKSSNYTSLGRLLFVGKHVEIYQNSALYSNTRGCFYYRLRGNFGNSFATLGGATNLGVGNLVDGQWHHLCFTWDGATTTAKVYEDGVLKVTNTSASGTLNSSTTESYSIGAENNGNNPIDGLIDEVGVWTTALSFADVTAIYNNGVPTDLNNNGLTAPTTWQRMGDLASWNGATWTMTDVNGSYTNRSINMVEANRTTDVPPNPFANTLSTYFDGVDDFVNCGDNDNLSFGNGSTDSPFSISAWIKMSDTSGFRILNKYTGSINEYSFGTGGAEKLQFYVFDSTSTFKYRARLYNTILNTGQWYHVVATYSGVGGTNAQNGIKIYVDGVRVDDTTISAGSYNAMGNKTTPVYIGKLDSSYSDGNIDEVSIFNTELSQSDITSIYNGGVPNDISSLSPLSWWRCGDGDTAPTLTDNGSGGNDGTMTNFSTFSTDVPSSFTNTKSILLDGVDDFVTMGNVLNMADDGTDSFSCSFWMKSNSFNTEMIVSKQLNSGSYNGFSIYIVQGRLYFFIGSGTSPNSQITGRSTNYVIGSNWNNVILTYDGSQDISGFNIYINGVSDSVVTISNNTPTKVSNTTDFQLSGRAGGTNLVYGGGLDEVAFWNGTELTSIQASEIGSTLPTDLSTYNPTSWWRCGDGDTSPTLTDNGSGGNNGTMTNFTTFSTDVPT